MAEVMGFNRQRCTVCAPPKFLPSFAPLRIAALDGIDATDTDTNWIVDAVAARRQRVTVGPANGRTLPALINRESACWFTPVAARLCLRRKQQSHADENGKPGSHSGGLPPASPERVNAAIPSRQHVHSHRLLTFAHH